MNRTFAAAITCGAFLSCGPAFAANTPAIEDVRGGDASALPPPGAIGRVIDSFEISQAVVADPVSKSRTGSVSGPNSSILGGHRDMFIEVLGGIAEAKLRSNPYSLNSNLQIDMSAGVTGKAVVTWDGVAGTTGADPDHGLAMDFTEGGMYQGIMLRLAVDAAGEGQTLELVLHSDDGSRSSAEIEFPVVPDVIPTVLEFVPFADFVGDADVTDVSAFQLIVDARLPSLDAQVDLVALAGPTTVDFETVPEPSSIVLMLAGLLAIAGRRRRNDALA